MPRLKRWAQNSYFINEMTDLPERRKTPEELDAARLGRNRKTTVPPSEHQPKSESDLAPIDPEPQKQKRRASRAVFSPTWFFLGSLIHAGLTVVLAVMALAMGFAFETDWGGAEELIWTILWIWTPLAMASVDSEFVLYIAFFWSIVVGFGVGFGIPRLRNVLIP